eukprot:gene43086-11970_t
MLCNDAAKLGCDPRHPIGVCYLSGGTEWACACDRAH